MLPKTGQTISYATGDDGDLERGVDKPPLKDRFTDNGDGSVQDNLTGLTWLKDANCFGQRTWNNALSDCNGLADGQCGRTDGSQSGDWRLTNRRKLFSLIHDDYYYPAVPNTAGTGQWTEGDPFNDVQSYAYWTSTTHVNDTSFTWFVYMGNGLVGDEDKGYHFYVWCVKGGY